MPTPLTRPPAAGGAAAMARLHVMPGHLIRRAHQIAGAIFAQDLAGLALTPVQYAALTAIRAHPGIDATRLSAAIVFDKSTLGLVLERLEAKGLVVRAADERDRRTKRLRLTPEGSRLLAEADPAVERAEARILAPLAPAERARMLRLLGALVAAHAADEARLT
jgi:MarR family transcriptional regulator, lower aerobic nicotinate degradation pathway regulator